MCAYLTSVTTIWGTLGNFTLRNGNRVRNMNSEYQAECQTRARVKTKVELKVRVGGACCSMIVTHLFSFILLLFNRGWAGHSIFMAFILPIPAIMLYIPFALRFFFLFCSLLFFIFFVASSSPSGNWIHLDNLKLTCSGGQKECSSLGLVQYHVCMRE